MSYSGIESKTTWLGNNYTTTPVAIPFFVFNENKKTIAPTYGTDKISYNKNSKRICMRKKDRKQMMIKIKCQMKRNCKNLKNYINNFMKLFYQF